VYPNVTSLLDTDNDSEDKIPVVIVNIKNGTVVNMTKDITAHPHFSTSASEHHSVQGTGANINNHVNMSIIQKTIAVTQADGEYIFIISPETVHIPVQPLSKQPQERGQLDDATSNNASYSKGSCVTLYS
jgi:hypothetical protein